MRHNHAPGPKDRLHDERRNRVGPLKGNLFFQCGKAHLRQLCRVAFVELVAIGIGRGRVETAGQHRFILRPEIGVAVDRCTTRVRAVIPFFQAQVFDPPGLTFDLVILSRKTQRDFHAVAAARGKERAAEPVRLEKFL